MAQDLTVLSFGKTARRSNDIIVEDVPVTIFAYSRSGTYPSAFTGKIQRKKGTAYDPVYDQGGAVLVLNQGRLEYTAYAPGTYSVDMLPSAYDIGIGTDSPD